MVLTLREKFQLCDVLYYLRSERMDRTQGATKRGIRKIRLAVNKDPNHDSMTCCCGDAQRSKYKTPNAEYKSNINPLS